MLRFAPFALAVLAVVGCGPDKPTDSESQDADNPHCEEPSNPYTEGTGHYAGYEWAEQKGTGTCDGKSQSFNEGCEEYEQQEEEYSECEERKKN
jgi:hypothetical protein